MFLDWDDDEVTQNGRDPQPSAPLPNLQPFNPRIRIIGMAPLVAGEAPRSASGEALQGPLHDDVPWDNYKTQKMAAVRLPPRPLPPPRRRSEPPPALQDTSEALPLVDADLEVVATAPSSAPSSAVTVSPIVSVEGPDPVDESPTAQNSEEEPETVDPKKEDRRPSHTRIGFAKLEPQRPHLVIAPLPAPSAEPDASSEDDDVSHVRDIEADQLDGLVWGEHESGTQPLLQMHEDGLPSDLAAALAHEPPPPEANARLFPAVEPDGPPVSLPSWEDEDDVTMPQRFANLQRRARELATAYRRRHGDPDSDTLVDSLSPRVIIAAEDDVPPATLVEASEPPVDTSVEIDLTHLERWPASAASPASALPASFEPSASDADDDVEPAPHAHRPASLPSIMPMTISEPPASPPRSRGRKGLVVAGALAALSCAAMVAVFLLPRDGALEVRLRTADGQAAARAEIFVDGQKRCDTDPCVVSGLSAGDKTVKVIVPGVAEPQVAKAAVVAGERQTLWVDIPSRQGVRIASSQPNVRVTVDGTPRGALPIEIVDLRAGEHTLTFEAEGHQPLSRKVQLRAGEILDLSAVALEPTAPGAVVDLHTEGARVVLTERGGSKQVLSGPWPMPLELAPGHYELVASARGHVPFERRFEVKPGASAEIDIALEPARRRARSAAPDDAAAAAAAAEAFDPYDGLD